MNEYTFDKFMDIIRKLRAPDGCPWDIKQTHESLKVCLIEEAYEAADSIDNKDIDNLREELGDLLLLIAMHSLIAQEKKEFTIEDVIQEISMKMIRRHPHVFGTQKADNSEQVLKNWEQIKQKEHKETTVSEGMRRIPKNLPANLRAAKVQKKADGSHLLGNNYEQVLKNVSEALSKLEQAKDLRDLKKIEEIYGNFLFSAVHLSRFLEINAEISLTNATNQFINRFEGIEGLFQTDISPQAETP